MYVCMCVCMYVCMYVGMYVCMGMYVYYIIYIQLYTSVCVRTLPLPLLHGVHKSKTQKPSGETNGSGKARIRVRPERAATQWTER